MYIYSWVEQILFPVEESKSDLEFFFLISAAPGETSTDAATSTAAPTTTAASTTRSRFVPCILRNGKTIPSECFLHVAPGFPGFSIPTKTLFLESQRQKI